MGSIRTNDAVTDTRLNYGTLLRLACLICICRQWANQGRLVYTGGPNNHPVVRRKKNGSRIIISKVLAALVLASIYGIPLSAEAADKSNERKE